MRPDLDHSSEDVAQRLRDLPSELQPPFGWAEFRRRERERPWPRRHVVKWPHAAAAAGVTVFIACMAMLGRSDQHAAAVSSSSVTLSPHSQARDPSSQDQAQQAARNAQMIAGMQSAALIAAQTARAARRVAVAQAEASKEWLARQPSEPAVVRVGPRLAVANLEDRIAWVDDALTDEQFNHVNAARVATLQQERARLMNSLVQVRYAETLAAVQ